MKRDGFTLIELLVVMAIIALLAGLLFPALGAAKKTAQKNKARTEVKSLEAAIKSYFLEYSKFPGPDSNGNPDFQTDTKDTDFMDELYGGNIKGIMYLEVSSADTNMGYFSDPWKSPYFIQVDGDFNNRVEGPQGEVNKQVLVWSLGPNTNLNDIIKSW